MSQQNLYNSTLGYHLESANQLNLAAEFDHVQTGLHDTIGLPYLKFCCYPRAHAQGGKVIGLVVVVVTPKIGISRDLPGT